MSEAHVVIVANGGANIASLQYALERLNVTSRVSAEPETIRAATHVILPGVGAAGDAMMRLRRDHLHELLPTLRQPVLGICLGMQLLFEASDEGQTRCLGIIPGRATRLAEAPGRRVPHIGWNELSWRPAGGARDHCRRHRIRRRDCRRGSARQRLGGTVPS